MKIKKLLIPLLFIFNSCSLIGGNFSKEPNQMKSGLSPYAKELLIKAREGLEGKAIYDLHSHLVGLGAGGTGAYVNEEMKSFWHPLKRLKFAVYKSGAAISNDEIADQQYVERLVDLTKHSGQINKITILAFDKHYKKDGSVDEHHTEFYTPNEYVFKIAKKYPQYFTAGISVHPYRKDALIELEKWAKQGARIVKWLPNAMGMDASDKDLRAYYEIMKKYNMTLLTHTGFEKAVEAESYQKLGNPLRFRFPLDLGVRVIMAHCASLGDGVDYDDPDKKSISNFKLFLRMMDNEKYKGLLFGEISALTQYNRFDGVLHEILKRPDLHSRLVNGSDYPLPAINIVFRTSSLKNAGFITDKERSALNEIYHYNPLLFDFALKRTVKHPKTKQQFSSKIFERPKFL